MAEDQPPRRPGGPEGASSGWTALGYLVAGMAVWGFVGWLIDRWLHTGGIAIAVGLLLGTAGGVYLIARRAGV